MKFFLFIYDEYYPGGGMYDYAGAYESVEDAQHYALERTYEHGNIAELTDEGLKLIESW